MRFFRGVGGVKANWTSTFWYILGSLLKVILHNENILVVLLQFETADARV